MHVLPDVPSPQPFSGARQRPRLAPASCTAAGGLQQVTQQQDRERHVRAGKRKLAPSRAPAPGGAGKRRRTAQQVPDDRCACGSIFHLLKH
jgi:hypothetical protein